jgi:hypothetical protein
MRLVIISSLALCSALLVKTAVPDGSKGDVLVAVVSGLPPHSVWSDGNTLRADELPRGSVGENATLLLRGQPDVIALDEAGLRRSNFFGDVVWRDDSLPAKNIVGLLLVEQRSSLLVFRGSRLVQCLDCGTGRELGRLWLRGCGTQTGAVWDDIAERAYITFRDPPGILSLDLPIDAPAWEHLSSRSLLQNLTPIVDVRRSMHFQWPAIVSPPGTGERFLVLAANAPPHDGGARIDFFRLPLPVAPIHPHRTVHLGAATRVSQHRATVEGTLAVCEGRDGGLAFIEAMTGRWSMYPALARYPTRAPVDVVVEGVNAFVLVREVSRKWRDGLGIWHLRLAGGMLERVDTVVTSDVWANYNGYLASNDGSAWVRRRGRWGPAVVHLDRGEW